MTAKVNQRSIGRQFPVHVVRNHVIAGGLQVRHKLYIGLIGQRLHPILAKIQDDLFVNVRDGGDFSGELASMAFR